MDMYVYVGRMEHLWVQTNQIVATSSYSKI